MRSVVVAFVVLVVAWPASAGEGGGAPASSGGNGGPAFPDAEARAVAVGYLLDSPRPGPVIDRALVIAEKLRLRYGIDTGRPVMDREEAVRRVQAEFLDRLEFSEVEIHRAAGKLGFSLDPARCETWCDNVRELAIVELKKLALVAFADGEAWPGNMVEPDPSGESALELEPEVPEGPEALDGP